MPPLQTSRPADPMNVTHPVRRRQLVLAGAGAVALAAAVRLGGSPSAWAQTAAAAGDAGHAGDAADPASAGFLALSRQLTGHAALPAVTAQRMLEAARQMEAQFAAPLPQLLALARTASTPQALLAAAQQAGLEAPLQALNAAWYTGTVTGPKGSRVVAYQDALMYAPVRDGLPAPTYCFNGPLWWIAPPPAAQPLPTG